MRGVCRWCAEAVTRSQARYEAMDGTVVHAACAEEFLLEAVGLRKLAELAGYEYRREVEDDADGTEEP